MGCRARQAAFGRNPHADRDPYGCMVVLSESLELEQRLALTNLATQASNAAVVVWRGNREPDGWEYGVELIAPDMNFWGLEL